MSEKLKIGVSACLVGEDVRHSGGHCRNRFVTDKLSEFADFVPTCPEVAIGMGVPRETVRLERDGDSSINMRAPKSGRDFTDAMRTFANERAEELKDDDLDGYIFKKDSPSCGVFRVKIYEKDQPAERRGTGLFAERMMAAHPNLPVEEDGRLSDSGLRENFIEQVFAYRRVKDLFAGHWSRKEVVDFQAREKMLMLSHSPALAKKIGQMVAKIDSFDRAQFKEDYISAFMACMREKPTKGLHANTLSHMAGFLKNDLSADGRRELKTAIEDYQNGLVPLIVPITMMQHFIRRFNAIYLAHQTYLMPHPKTLMLRNST